MSLPTAAARRNPSLALHIQNSRERLPDSAREKIRSLLYGCLGTGAGMGENDPAQEFSSLQSLNDKKYALKACKYENHKVMKNHAQSGVNSVLEALGATVRQRRRKLELTQAELAGLCGVGVRFVSELESGKPGLEFGRAVHVMQLLGLELAVRSREVGTDLDGAGQR